MLHLFAMLCLLTLSVNAALLAPYQSITLPSIPTDIVYRQGLLYVATERGEALTIDEQGKVRAKVILPKRIDAWGDKQTQKLLSLDASPDGKTVALAAEDGRLYLATGGTITPTVFTTTTVIRKVLFLSATRVAIALITDELYVVDIAANRIVGSLALGTSALSDMARSPDGSRVAIAGEAGIVTIIDPTRLTISARYKGGNVDNIYRLDWQGEMILTAGQDRRAILYGLGGKILKRFDGTFLIYAAALAPRADYAVLADGENGIMRVVDTATAKTLHQARGHKAALSRVLFLDRHRFVSIADEPKLYFWKIP